MVDDPNEPNVGRNFRRRRTISNAECELHQAVSTLSIAYAQRMPAESKDYFVAPAPLPNLIDQPGPVSNIRGPNRHHRI